MASIKISSLPVLEADRLTKNDQFIVNDENSATTRLSYEDLVTSITTSNQEFTKVVTFSGIVNITGEFNALNVYDKDGTDAAIADAIAPLKIDIADNADAINDLVALTGLPKGTLTILGNQFTSPTTQAGGPYNQLTIVQKLDSNAAQDRQIIEALSIEVNKNSTDLRALDLTSDPKGRVTVLEEAVEALEDVVGINGENVTDNTDNVATNAGNIAHLATCIGTDVGLDYVSLGGTLLSGHYKVGQALEVLDAAIITDRATVTTLTGRVGVNEGNISANAEYTKALITTIQAAAASVEAADTAEAAFTKLSDAIAQAIVDGTLPGA